MRPPFPPACPPAKPVVQDLNPLRCRTPRARQAVAGRSATSGAALPVVRLALLRQPLRLLGCAPVGRLGLVACQRVKQLTVRVPLRQLAAETGLSRPSLVKAKDELARRKIVLRFRDQREDGGDASSVLFPNYDFWVVVKPTSTGKVYLDF